MTSWFDWGSLFIGAGLGAGGMAVRKYLQDKNARSSEQRRMDRALDAELQMAREDALPLDGAPPLIIFSDLHKGARNQADDFLPCEQTYLTALDHYYDKGYALLVLGDAEELWEERVEKVIEAYGNVLRSEARFHPGRYLRIFGNHDDNWEDPAQVKRYLHPFFPDLEVRSSYLLRYNDPKDGDGEILLTHGHQGSLESDLFSGFSRRFLPLYREFQKLTGFGRTSLSDNACLRGHWESMHYNWVSQHQRLVMVAGHTHRPVWSSLTHLEKLSYQLMLLYSLAEDDRPPDFEEQTETLKKAVRERQEKTPPCNDTVKTRACYFNDGSCRFKDGDITGIEIENGVMRLVKWEKDMPSQRLVLESGRLAELFALL